MVGAWLDKFCSIRERFVVCRRILCVVGEENEAFFEGLVISF